MNDNPFNAERHLIDELRMCACDRGTACSSKYVDRQGRSAKAKDATAAVIETALRSCHRTVQEAALANPNITSNLVAMVILKYGPFLPALRRLALRHPKATAQDLVDFLNGDDPEGYLLRDAAASNPNVPVEALAKILRDRSRIGSSAQVGAARNPNLTVELFDVVLSSGHASMQEAALRNGRPLTEMERRWVQSGWLLSTVHDLKRRRLTAETIESWTLPGYALLADLGLAPDDAWWRFGAVDPF